MHPITMNRTTSGARPAEHVEEHIIEIVSDSGEGAQTCGANVRRPLRPERQRHLDG